MSLFFERVRNRQETLNTLLCVGLDPDTSRFPDSIRDSSRPIFGYNKAIIDATQDLACCYKPQIAHYSAEGAEDELAETIQYLRQLDVPVLLDAKRGDVGSTAEMYARELFERYGADAATINPYLGYDSMAPYLEYAEKGLFVLCRTSNAGGADIQELVLKDGRMLYELVAEHAATRWNRNGNVGLVVGATQPVELSRIRELAPELPFLVPGIGAQGGDIDATIHAGAGGMMLLSSSRAILYAGDRGDDFEARAREEAVATRDAINAFRAGQNLPPT